MQPETVTPQVKALARKQWWHTLRFELNFYRIHWLFFTLHPLIWSGIFYAANGQYKVPYIDCLFLCVSSQTVTGLSTVNLSTTTGFQQFVLFWFVIQLIIYTTVPITNSFSKVNDYW
jgi:hypothetical protein